MRKLRIVRIVTAAHVVPWHLHNTLTRIASDFEVCVIGQNVSMNRSSYVNIKFVDIDINRKRSYFSDVCALLKLCKFYFSYRPDIVHSIMPKAGLLSAIAGFVCRVPLRMHTFTGQTWIDKTGFLAWLYWMLDRLINMLNTVCLTDSFSQSEFLFRHKIYYVGRPLPVLSKGSLSGVDVTRFRFDVLEESALQVRTELGLSKGDFVFAFIARKTLGKGAVDILRAFALVRAAEPNAKLLYVGPDEDGVTARLRKTNCELFHDVVEVGQVTNHEVYLAITDVLCLPSYREGFGSIVIDAAALGVPAIGSRIPGLVDAIVDGETGLLCAAGDIDELARTMIRFIEDRKLQQIMGNRARQRVHDFFTADKLYGALKDFYILNVAKVAGDQGWPKTR